jgi:excinuclease ABC subunit B
LVILDADKEGFLRSDRSLIQTIGRAARNLNGKAILYADEITGSMQRAMDESNRRRDTQIEFNKRHKITPVGVKKKVLDVMEGAYTPSGSSRLDRKKSAGKYSDTARLEMLSSADLSKKINILEEQMYEQAKNLDFESAAKTRDEIADLRESLLSQ